VAGGKRQISAFHIAGDIPDLQSLHLEVLDVSIATVTPCKLAFIQHATLLRLCEAFPRITAAFWRETLIEAAVSREWVANVGQRRAPARIAHVLCEFFLRMRAVGLTEDHACQFPINQAQLGDATGMSAVHVNRSLQELRAAGLISLKGHSLKILDWAELKAQGDFEPSYLHMERRQDAA
jgi:CRP-like cAMP-binding protein